MRYGVLSDIHSNREALGAVLQLLQREGAEGYLCLGDVVGYGPEPNEVIERLRSLSNLTLVAGNHDRAATGDKDLAWFNPHAAAAARWTQTHLSPENRAFLRSLPERAHVAKATLVHGTPRDPIDEYLLHASQLRENAALFSTPVCFVGHSHIPFVMPGNPRDPRPRLIRDGETVSLDPSAKSIVNPGSVGQPRDGDPKASCAVFDDDTLHITLFRVDYDIEAVQEKMRRERFPGFLIERLAVGQ